MSGSWAPAPVLALAHLAGAAALAWTARALLDHGTQGRRLLLAYLLPYAVTYAVTASRAGRAGREGRLWAREEWRLHWVALCLAPVLSAGAAPLFERSLGLDGLTAPAAGAAIGCGVTAFLATLVVSVRVMYAREVLKRAVPAPGSATRLPTTVS
ncbi:hypothetical protein CW362_35960 [Streptomyces populi]|uniref:Uncharacterized protein n=1 Tax=Streptomyces populi TaxID=2058924 RepID=A0A2I0SEB5_9ACTN|nr:hypothetical protein CW362_35960 [Streptomyces populi]